MDFTKTSWTFLLLLLILDHLPSTTVGYNLPDRIAYSRDFLPQLQHLSLKGAVIDEIPGELQRKHPPDQTSALHRNKRKVTRRGKKKGGIRARLKGGEIKQQTLPSVILANIRSLRNKIDELQANVFHMFESRSASILAFTEMWLNGNDSSDSLHIVGFGSPVRLDRDTQLTGKHHGGGVCLC